MEPQQFSCPHCATRLRIRDALAVGRQVPCPDCGSLLEIVSGEAGLSAVARSPTPVPAAPTAASRAAPRGAKPQRPRHGQTASSPKKTPWWRTPLVWAWAGAGCVATGALAWSLVFVRTPPPDPPPTVAAAPQEPSGPPERDSGRTPPIDPSPDGVGAAADELSARLARLGERLLDTAQAEATLPPGTFPAPGLAPKSRLSWLAILADRSAAAHPAVAWELPWNDPQNEDFVRRRLVEFQNPAIKDLTGADGYPATHFVGVAGVGSDAAQLPRSDPRAGPFGHDRVTRWDDLRAGAAQTWLVLGVREQLGSWGAGGRPTVRPLAAEPFVNGPDGFGTGQPDSMLVLLADGRVQTVSAAADPAVVRRLATLSGTLSAEDLDDDLSPEGLASDDDDGPAIGERLGDAVDDVPLEPEFAPDAGPRRIDLAVSLRQPIARFELPRPRPLGELLPGLAEMLGAPIRVEAADLGDAAAALRSPVQARLENTSVGEILDNLLRPSGLSYAVEQDHLRIIVK